MNPENEQKHDLHVVEIVKPAVAQVTAEVVDLKLKALKSDLRLMIIASVALNQVLSNVQLPSAVTATAVAAAILAPLAKGAVAFFTRQ